MAEDGGDAVIGAVIMAHPVRDAAAMVLSERTGASIVWDENGAPTSEPRRRWSVGVRAWEAAARMGCEWSMVLQDDAIACRDLIPGLEDALEQFNGAGVISPYTGRGRPDQKNTVRALQYARQQSLSWISFDRLKWGVAIIIPTDAVSEMVSWGSLESNREKNYDSRIGAYFQTIKKWRVWHTVPSLVDHPPNGSLIQGDNPWHTRIAHNFIGENNSALDIDWSKTPMGGLKISL